MRILLQQYQGEDELNYNADARSDVGTGHIDNNKGALGLDHYNGENIGDIDTFIAQLVNLIDDLINQINESNDSLRDAELDSVEAFIQYKSQLERENAVLRKFIQQWGDHVEDLEVTLENNQNAEDECNALAATFHEDAENKQSKLDTAGANAHTRAESLSHTIDLLEQVISIYIEKVVSAKEVTSKESKIT